jgi:cell division protein FtsI (penicillin-binding protein 3)
MRETLKPERRGAMADIPNSKSGKYDDLSYVLKELNIPVEKGSGSNTGWVTTSVGDAKLELKPREMDKNLVPNVVGMGLKDALYLLEERELRVSVRGRGRVISQSITPGTKVLPNGNIILEMR